jgi:sirohydrochlorin cobaltochelatase
MTLASTSKTLATKGHILFAHGSRDPLWCKPIEAIAQAVQLQNASTQVRCAYLELMQPDLATTVQELLKVGTQEIAITPLFLGVGKHAREDLPHLLLEIQTRYPACRFKLNPSIGEDPSVIEAIATAIVAKS